MKRYSARQFSALMASRKSIMPSSVVGHRSGLERLSIAASLGGVAWNYASKARAWRTARQDAKKFTLTLTEDDDIWLPVERWLTEELRAADTHHMNVRSFSDDDQLLAYYTDDRERTLHIEGHRIVVARVNGRAEMMREWASPGSVIVNTSYGSEDRFTFTVETEAGRDALLRKLNTFLKVRQKGPFFYRHRAWGGWKRLSNKDHRPLDSVILPGDMSERLVKDIETFLRAEAEYNKRGIPWHRGYLFYGPPGTGKTSLIRAVCGHVGVNVYYLSLSGVKDDAQLFSLVEELEDGDALIIEDVDVYKSAHERNGEGATTALTLDGLLQVTDGAFTPHGALIFLTTNRRDKLDDALIRPGRCDFQEELGFLDQDQLDRLITKFVGTGQIEMSAASVTPADVIGALKDTMFLSTDEQLRAIEEVVSK